VIIADATKLVPVLGKAPVPVEVVPFAQALVATEIAALGADVSIRQNSLGKPLITDEGHHILDCCFGTISDPPTLAQALREIPGVVEHGLFIHMADVVLIGEDSGVRQMRAPKN
jgi:ribose 5-phosphate isomerase A